MKISNCCGAPQRSNGPCPKCKQDCIYIEYCDDCGEEIDDCVCDENLADEKLKQELENDPEITEILEQINKNPG